MLAQNLARVRVRMHAACARVGRDPASVTLVAVTKGIAVECIREAVACGLTELGENRVQEALEKIAALSVPTARWHLIGHLQRNKAKHAVELFSVIHSVDSIELAETLERHMNKPLEVFIQVNVSGEDTKFGCTMEEALPLARRVMQLPHLRLRGLMTMAPFADDPERARPHFRRLRELRDELLSHLSPRTSHLALSMGMSGDYEVAIEEGADLVRIGTALFGPR